MAGWKAALLACVTSAAVLAGCVGSEPATPTDASGGAVEAEAAGEAANGTHFRFDGLDEPFNTSAEYADSIPMCPPPAVCEPVRQTLPAGLPTGVTTLVYGELRHDPSDYTIVVMFDVEDGEVRGSSSDWSEPGITTFSAELEIFSGEAEMILQITDLRTEEVSYEISLHAWADAAVVPSGDPVRLELSPGTNLSVESIVPPHRDGQEPDDFAFILYDGGGRPVVRQAEESTSVTFKVPADAERGRFSFVPYLSGAWMRLRTDAVVDDAMERFELERVFGPARLIGSPEGISWSEDFDQVPVRVGVYLQTQGAWAMTSVPGQVRVTSPAGVVVDEEIGCSPPPTYCAIPWPGTLQTPVSASALDDRVVPGTYDFEVVPGAWSYTHAGTYVTTLPS